MTLEKAYKIAHIWGTHLSSGYHAKLNFFFGLCNIPESFLPFPRNVLEEALNIASKDQYHSGNTMAIEDYQRSVALLKWYIDDEEAMLKVAENFNDKKLRDILLSRLKKYQDGWIATQEL